jgi:hypothetical protein
MQVYQDYTAAVDTVKQAHQEKKFKVRRLQQFFFFSIKFNEPVA